MDKWGWMAFCVTLVFIGTIVWVMNAVFGGEPNIEDSLIETITKNTSLMTMTLVEMREEMADIYVILKEMCLEIGCSQ